MDGVLPRSMLIFILILQLFLGDIQFKRGGNPMY